MKKLTLIGGAPLAGKTTLSKEIAKQDGAVELSTDSIRSWMKKIVSRDENPELFFTSGLTAEQFYEVHTTSQMVVDGEIAEGKHVEKGILALLETAITWEHLVIEGIAISPEFVEMVTNRFKDREVEGFIIVDEDKERITKRIGERGLWGPLGSYPERLMPKEVEWVILYNKWFKSEAQKHNVEIRFN